MTERSSISVAIFYGPANDPAVNHVPVDKLTPEMGWQQGRYYPATPTQPAILLVTRMDAKASRAIPAPTDTSSFVSIGPLPPAAIDVLKRLGIPTTLPK
jgi:hypothetical protein